MKVRIARSTNNLTRISQMYMDGLGFQCLSSFENHQGFDGIIIGDPYKLYHLEFTHHKAAQTIRAPDPDNLLVFYIPDQNLWRRACSRMIDAGFVELQSFNPYWDISGRTFEDVDGYRVVIQNQNWTR